MLRLLQLFFLVLLFVCFGNFISANNNIKNNNEVHNLVIIGSGPAGLTAAMSAGRADLNPIVIEGDPGGQFANAGIVDNWPTGKTGFGKDFTDEMREKAEQAGAKFIPGLVHEVNFLKKPFEINLDDMQLLAKSVIIATGATYTKLNCIGEDKYIGRGVAFCGKCDGPLFKGKSIIVIGGKQSALVETDLLCNLADKITVINKANDLTGLPKLINKIKEHPKVKIMNNCKVVEILGNDDWVTGVKIVDNKNHVLETIPAEGIFIARGKKAVSDLFKGQLSLDSKGRIKVKNGSNTSVRGVFAAGDVRVGAAGQALPASASGQIAAMHSEEYLRKNKSN